MAAPSLSFMFDLWLASWDRELSALAAATQSRTLSVTEAAAHKTLIKGERELVTRQFALLLGRELPQAGIFGEEPQQ